MGSGLLLALVLLTSQPGPAGVSPDQYLRIVRSSYADVKSLSFVFEGRKELVFSEASAERREFKRGQFDGNYIWRSDGSILNDVYVRFNRQDMLHVSAALFGGKVVRLARIPDNRYPPSVKEFPPTGFAIGSDEPTPHHLIWFWYYDMLKDPKALKYQDLGWDVVDGRRCLKVELDLSVVPEGRNNSRYRFWLDLERGAQPLRVDWLVFPPKVSSTVHSIALESFPISAEKQVWLPVSAVEDTFVVDGTRYSETPVWQTTIRIVKSSVVLNRSIPDSAFSVKDPKPDPRGAGGVMKRTFDELFVKSPPPERTDPKSIEDRLNKELEEADRQSRMIEASSPSGEFWSATLLFQLGFFTVGVTLFAWTVILIRRSR